MASAETDKVVNRAHIDFASMRSRLIEQVLRAMKDAFERLKLSMLLPKIIENYPLLVRVLTGTHYGAAIRLVDNFLLRRTEIYKKKLAPLEDHGMVRIIDYFQRHHLMYTLFPNLMNKLTEQEQKLLFAFGQLMDMAKAHLERNATDHIKLERSMQKLYKKMEKVKMEVEEVKRQIDSRYYLNLWKKSAKAAYLQNILEEMRIKREEQVILIEKEADKYRRIVNANIKVCLEKENEHIETLTSLRLEDEKKTKIYKKQEKEQRDEKNKLQIQLQGLIQKYDTAIGEKMIENMKLNDLLTEAKQKLKEYMPTYRKEQTIYNEIVVKREKEEARRRSQAIMLYRMNRAARKIQKYWRTWRAHMKKKERGAARRSKGKGKK